MNVYTQAEVSEAATRILSLNGPALRLALLSTDDVLLIGAANMYSMKKVKTRAAAIKTLETESAIRAEFAYAGIH